MEPLRIPPSPALRHWSEERGFSPELVARWGAFYPDLPGLVEAMQRPPATFLRTNGLQGAGDETVARLRQKGFTLVPAGLADVWRVDEQPFSVGATEEYLLGRYYLQDASSALAALALEPRPDDVVADLCAAPGGKTIQMADLMQGRGAILAFDKEPARARALVSNVARCGVTNVAVYEAPGQSAKDLGFPCDRVLLDAPCTGEGVTQRDPSRRRGYLGEYAACAREQTDLLATAEAILKDDGVLVYSTCTLAPEENEMQVQRALERGFRLEPLPKPVAASRLNGNALWPGLTRVGDRALDPTLTQSAHVLPHLHGCLGFYLARLRKGGGR